ADIIIKKGNHLDLIEVKSKSFKGDDVEKMTGTRGSINAGWKPYLYDVAFQKHVIQKAYPQFTVTALLMLADKESHATVDGLNQKFFIRKDQNGRVSIEVIGDITPASLGEQILRKVNIDTIATGIINGSYGEIEEGMTFAGAVDFYADHYDRDEPVDKPVGEQCAKCEFDCGFEEEAEGFHSGFRECWRRQLNWTDDQFREPHIFEIWNFKRKQHLINEYVYHISDVQREHIGDFKPSKDGRLSTNERQWLQVEMTRHHVNNPYLDVDGLRDEMSKWKYPLHFIDFETSRVAIPFHRGRRPYEGIAFQFSHHTVDRVGTVKHAGEYINVLLGEFPNYKFVRALKEELERDDGTIFRYADHENSFLVEIWKQLSEETDVSVPDRKELMDFIQSITHSSEDYAVQWRGEREMVDMLKLVKNYFYHIDMKGSNSIKVVLPAVLKASTFLRNKYSMPVYGVQGGIESHNFANQTWYTTDDRDNVINPYKLLEPVFNDMARAELDETMVDDTIASGGAAMTAYARMQFTRLNNIERELARKALLRYCELDTLAMVMIYEYWEDQVGF
ncbi:DUF2779 domain-containing protein, partial [bacterium]|nr:DUF2779 domain-containing protein [bacterium]